MKALVENRQLLILLLSPGRQVDRHLGHGGKGGE